MSRLARLRALPARAYGRVARHEVRRRLWALSPDRAAGEIADAELARKFGAASPGEVIARLRWQEASRFFLPPGGAFERAAEVDRRSPGAAARTLARAEAICAHRFDLLGSGPTDLGPRLPWRRDFLSGHEWPPDHFTRLKIVDLDAGFDVKMPWELSRFHHAVTLGQAYAFSREHKYPREFAAQVKDWQLENPPEFGPNWANAMEAAIRAANWIWAFELMQPALDDDFVLEFARSLWQHGRYIRRHLESGWPGSNHYLADLCGLIWLGLFLRPAAEADEWLRFGLHALAGEMRTQVYPDGADYEASTSYHLLVTEMILWTAAYCRVNGIELPAAIAECLPRMLDVIACLLRPDGSLPLFGDCDSGRWLALESDTEALVTGQDPRGVLAIGSALFERQEWAEPAGERWEAAAWAFGESVPPAPSHAGAASHSEGDPGAVAFSQAGWYVLSSGGRYPVRLYICAGHNGSDGWGLHAHNDALSFELSIGERVFLVDPGSYAYTGDYGSRNLFRSTAMHNTVRVDGQEISRIPERDMFRMEKDARVRAAIGECAWEGEHDGYRRLPGKVVHRRRIEYDAARGRWLIHDRLTGAGEHSLEWFFHFAPLPAICDGLSVLTACAEGPNLRIMPEGDAVLALRLDEGWYSPRYGVRRRAPVACYYVRANLPAEFILAVWPLNANVEQQRRDLVEY